MSWIKLADREDAKDRTKIRAMFRTTAHVPIIEDERFTEPTLDGKSGGWFTKGGSPITYEGSSLTIRIPKGFKVR
jgi:hypothetical protein